MTTVKAKKAASFKRRGPKAVRTLPKIVKSTKPATAKPK